MYIKVHNAYRTVVAICDSDLIGKSFEQGNKILNVRENFYNGEKKSEQEIIKLMKDYSSEDATFNIIGSKSVDCALKADLVTKEGIKLVQGIPFALVLL